ncbi:ABC-F family ATP-binding cassette domain-containing protein [Corallococcus exiguus]|uniref:ABC-F family ATP-binding cassette domain-containing protein n=1 Tax=Corallococcus TaxID=83461 RepID=UPI000EDE9772|nr:MULTISPECIES: ABC-F family ATP-binding cassette domain-containing protein [Corallococcus]NNB84691.1 ABC-F family ATP-binding cassette domain-containing protein [Corallococcus exiguus]NNC05926.1 ABC-F family ATP-binding cassette domain-containing protein [Corallococcus exiguus]NPC46381.1 ABC-F family ATP-binding cassette domain-containing protein [Corallococcus exiguus]RKH81363.1 ABC transporter ATP-binding protein [Corallococcus sp. AB032C]
MSLVIAQDISLAYGKKVLFDEDNFTLGPRDRVGLVGANGTGKSSLMKIIAGASLPDGGTVQYSRRARAGYLPQEIAGLPEGTVVEAVMSTVPGRDSLEVRLKDTEAALAGSSDEEEQLELAQTLADLHAELDDFENRYGRHHAERILKGLGFKDADLSKPTQALSGGWRMRAALAGLLLQDPDLLLLDEPTNHLDVPTLAWFDGFLRRSNKAMVLISHDRDFLNRQINRVVSLEMEGVREYSGNYEDYKRQRAEEMVLLQARAEKVEQRRSELQGFIDRFGAKATKAKQAQSRAKMLAKLEKVQVLEERQTMKFRFPEVERSGRDVVLMEDITKRYGPLTVYDGLNARLERGQRIAVVGANGAGKTTLLKMVAGELAPDSGKVTVGHNVVVGYYAQHHADKLDRRNTIIEEVRPLAEDKPESYVRGVLGAFLFSGDDVDKPIGVLSGGERARVALAKLLLVPSNFLLMDEPTNHLDLDSSEMLIEALKLYGGTLLFVSHNRSFINNLCTHVWEVADGKLTSHAGNLDEYLYHQEQLRLTAEGADTGAASGKGGAAGAGPVSEKDRKRQEAEARQRRSVVEGPIKKEIAKLEERIAKVEAEQKEREGQLADPVLYNDFARAKPLMDAHRTGKEELEDLYARWEAAQEKLAAAQA